MPDGREVRTCGIVTPRQQPDTANRTIFVSLEDEHGAVQVIVWRYVREAQRQVLLNARLLAVKGPLAGRGAGLLPDRQQAGGPDALAGVALPPRAGTSGSAGGRRPGRWGEAPCAWRLRAGATPAVGGSRSAAR